MDDLANTTPYRSVARVKQTANYRLDSRLKQATRSWCIVCLDDQGSDELDVGVESSARVLHRAYQLGSGVHRSNHDRLDHSVGDRRPLRGRLSAVDAFPRLPLSYSSRPPFSSRSSFHPTFQRCQSRDRRPIASSVSVSRFCSLGLNILLRCEVRCGSQLAARVCVCVCVSAVEGGRLRHTPATNPPRRPRRLAHRCTLQRTQTLRATGILSKLCPDIL